MYPEFVLNVKSNKDKSVLPIVNITVYPNPANSDIVNFRLTNVTNVNSLEIRVYNIKGQMISRSNEFQVRNGDAFFTWDKKDVKGHNVASGVYTYQIISGNTQLGLGRFLVVK